MTWPRPVLWAVFLPQDVACCQALPSGERVATPENISKVYKKYLPGNAINFHIWSKYKAIIAGIRTYRNIFIKILLTYVRQPINERRQIMWQSSVSDFPQPVFKASSLRNLLKFLTKRSFINWQMYMRSIYWQAMPKVKKKSDKQWQRLDKVRKRDERATNEKEAQAKHALKNRAYRV